MSRGTSGHPHPDETRATDVVASLEVLGSAARQGDMSPDARAATRLAVARALARSSAAPRGWSWYGPLAKAAALLLLLGGAAGLVLTMQGRQADQERLATEARVAALEANIDRMHLQIEGRVARWRERYASHVAPRALVTTETERLGSRIGVHRAVLRGELEEARRWAGDSIDRESPYEGGYDDDRQQDDSSGETRRAPRPTSVWWRNGDPVLAGVPGVRGVAS